MSANGTINWFDRFGGSGQDRATDVKMIHDQALLTGYFRAAVDVSGRTYRTSGLSDFFVNKFQLPPAAITSDDDVIPSVALYPNPSTDEVIIESEDLIQSIRIYDMAGQCVYDNKAFDVARIKVVIKSFKPGPYVAMISTGSRIHEVKLIKL